MNTQHTIGTLCKRVAFCVGAALVLVVSARARDASVAAKVDIKAVKSIQVSEADGRYLADVRIQFRNGNKEAVRLDKAAFAVGIGTQGLSLGKGSIPTIELAGGTVTESVIRIDLGSASDTATRDRLVALLNLLCNPTAAKTVNLKGESDLSVSVPRGWVTQKSIAVEFTFQPKLQNEVLFE